MEDIKSIIAQNITQLRKESGLTQLELAEKLNYSDKAISKWERGESLPDIIVLKTIADMFSVTVDYLLKSDHEQEKELQRRVAKRKVRNRAIISCISIMLVWLVATVVFFVLDAATSISTATLSICFVYAVPTSMVVWLVFNSIWFNKRRNFLIISLLMWTSLAALFITFIGFRLWLMFIVGIPAQIIIWLWSGLRTRNPRK
ncbi:MAG: helix-turn-helix transcriptional regulator [Clostridia bacterium]|nr:helix-turn-helix transcriptional regulator [Clostridia bacterium]